MGLSEQNITAIRPAYSILVVDDEPSIRGLLAKQLKEAGFEAQEAQDGLDALVKLRDMHPHAIISDLEMPRMSGIEFIGVVRKRLPKIPVIVFSGTIPDKFPARAMPDASFEKDARQIPELLKAVLDLVGKSQLCSSHLQVDMTPARPEQVDDDHFVLACAECLRLFREPNTPEDKRVQRIGTCPHCAACVPYLVESSDPE